ncbi:MAG: sulfite exporter TauE/SafE family protein [bacterium]|nr:sulfite exporter TauE/SafE family protein [bacterium]
MDTTLVVILTSAIGVGFLHALFGIDHSLPFVVLARAQKWTLKKTLAITGLCGLGHVLSSAFLGAAGVVLGLAVKRLEWIESTRGSAAGWALIVFGIAYTGWSFARRRRHHRHSHAHGDTAHSHEHTTPSHSHGAMNPVAFTAWSLFVIFVLGPCEPLIPLLIVPAVSHGVWSAAAVGLVFGTTTIATMLGVVAIGYAGAHLSVFKRIEPYTHVLAGLAISVSGVAIMALGL